MSQNLVSVAALAARLGERSLRVVDASWHMPAAGRDAAAEHAAGHIPGALFLDLDSQSDHASALPHMLPQADAFASWCGANGIGLDDWIVCYDDSDVRSAARAWWMFRAFGFATVAVLDGGLAAWRAAGQPLTQETATASPVTPPRLKLELGRVRSLDQMRANLAAPAEQVVDARAAPRFAGEAPEPRSSVRAGHIPGSRNLPYGRLFADDGRMKPGGELRALFTDAGIDLARPVVTSCGSGVTAAVLALALAQLGKADVALYDGSWTEWGSQSDTPISTGPA